jgi:hypothetical protein
VASGKEDAQQQQQQVDGESALDLQQLQGVLNAHHPDKATRVKQTMHPFNMWSAACGSTDVKTMLQQPAVLLQAL